MARCRGSVSSCRGPEFAQMFRRVGAQGTAIERPSRLIVREDEDVLPAIREIVQSENIAARTGAECIAFAPHADGRNGEAGLQ